MYSPTVKASVLYGAKDLRLESRELPPPASDEVQIAIQSAGLCGSDLHYYTHYRNGDILVREPLTLGHESSGTIVSVGAGVTGLVPGDHVALEVGLPCEKCDYCRGGRYNICRGVRFRSSAKSSPHAQGTLQERVNHPARWCHKLPDHLSFDLGAIAEPLSVALHARRRANLPEDSSVIVVIFGAGAVGLLTAAVCKAAKAEAVVVIADIQKDRVDFATQNGFADAGYVVPMAARPHNNNNTNSNANANSIDEKLLYASDVAASIKAVQVDGKPIGEQVAAVFECTGVETCTQASIYATRPGGKVVIVGMGNPVLTLPMSAAALREVDIVGVFRYANTYAEVIQLLSDPPASMPDLRPLVTHRFKGMDAVGDAFAMAAKVKDDEGQLVLKVVVDVNA